jgi:hypothetical protein
LVARTSSALTAAVFLLSVSSASARPPVAPLQLDLAIEAGLPEPAVALDGGDFDGDGSVDLAMATRVGDVYVALNPGGGLASWSWALVGSVPLGLSNEVYSGMKVADLDADGLSDLLLFGDVPLPGSCAGSVLTSLGDGNFAAGASLAIVAPTPEDIVFGCAEAELGDYDGNGALDVAIAYAYQPLDWGNGLLGSVNVFLGGADGEFSAPTQHPLAEDPAPYVSFAMTSGDFDGDGHTDLGFGSAVRYLSGPVAWRVETLRGDGAGGFAPGALRAFDCAWCELEFARSADFDGNGRADLLLAPTNPEDYPSDYPVLLFASQDDGTFAAPQTLSVHAGTVGVEARDITRDGLPDVLLLGDVDHVTVLEGQGDGTFAPPSRFVTGRRAASSALLDLDADGASELVMPSYVVEDAAPVFEIARGTPAGSFALPPVSRVPSGYPEFLAPPADFDGDGNADVLTIGFGQLELMLGAGDGRFELGASTPTDVSPWPLPVADLNGDGRLDLVQAAGDGFAVAVGLADNTFAATPPAVERSIGRAALGDIDGDGRLDLAATEWPGESVDIYVGDGALGFTRALSLPVDVYVSELVLTDLNADGVLDLFVGAEGLRYVPDGEPAGTLVSPTWLGDGHGGFNPGPPVELSGRSFRAADIDLDGALDLLSPNGVSFGDGAGNFAPPEPLPSAGLWWIELADLDADGLVDLLFQQDGLMLARGGPGGRFEPALRLTGASGWRSFAVGQFVGSRQLDLVSLHEFTTEDRQQTELIVARNATASTCGPARR